MGVRPQESVAVTWTRRLSSAVRIELGTKNEVITVQQVLPLEAVRENLCGEGGLKPQPPRGDLQGKLPLSPYYGELSNFPLEVLRSRAKLYEAQKVAKNSSP